MKNLLMWCLLLLWTASARAEIRFERFIPTNPTADSAPTAELWFSGFFGVLTCDIVGTAQTLVADSVSVNGNVVHLQIPVYRQPGPCVIGVPQPGQSPHTWRYPLLRLPKGSYTLEIVGRRVSSNDPLFSIATVPLTIGAGSLVEIPTLTGWALAFLTLVFLTFGALRIRLKSSVTFSLLLVAGNLYALPPAPIVPETVTIEITLRAGQNRITADALVSNGLNGELLSLLANPALSNLRLAQDKRPTGDRKRWLEARPDSPAAVLTRIAFVDVQNRERASAIVVALRQVNDVQGAYILPEVTFSAGPAPSPNQDGQVSIRADLARRWQSGWALIGSADSGIQTNHPKLAAFDGVNPSIFRDAGTYQGGSFLWAYAGDDIFGGRDIDERRCVSTNEKGVNQCIRDSLGFSNFWNQSCHVVPGTVQVQGSLVGHGTHQVGIAVASNRDTVPSNAGLDFSGICAGCSLAMRRAVKFGCTQRLFFGENFVDPILFESGLDKLSTSLTSLIESGVQVFTLSFSSNRGGAIHICAPGNSTLDGSYAFCSALVMARQRGGIVVAAAGNTIDELSFPASEPDVFPAMGFIPTTPAQYWQVGVTPVNPFHNGSSYGSIKPGFDPGDANYLGYAELQAPAFEIRSTFYLGQVWNLTDGCESFDHNLSQFGISDASNASYFGICTGTSMAAPALAGVAALVRSTNPLLVVGDSAFDNGSSPAVGVRDVMVRSAHNGYVPGNVALAPATTPPLIPVIPAQQAWGFGIVDAEAALIKTMGVVAGQVVKHRLTPLFQLYSSQGGYADFAYTTSPQSALALNEYSYYSPNSTSLVQGFSQFMQPAPTGKEEYFPPVPEGFNKLPAADFFILANDYRTSATQADPDMPLNVADPGNYRVEPLFWMSRCRFTDVGCGLQNAEFLVALERELTQLNSIGYELRGRIGFVIACKTASCTSGAPTIPSMERIYRAWKGTNLATSDSALMGTSMLSASMLSGSIYYGYYTATAPAGIPAWPEVYAFRNINSDAGVLINGQADELIDGQELLAGTNEMAADSDCDGLADSIEYPVAGVPQSDPMSTLGTCADMRIAKTQIGSTTYRVSNPLGPNAALSVTVTIFYGGTTVSPPFSPSWPTVPSGWSCTQAYTIGAFNAWNATATCTKNGGVSFGIGELTDFNVPHLSGQAPPYQATVTSYNDPAATNNLANWQP